MTNAKTRTVSLFILLLALGKADAANIQTPETGDSNCAAPTTQQADSQHSQGPDARSYPEPIFRLDGPSEGQLSNRELFFKMMLSVLLVAVLGIAAVYISRKLLPKITTLPGKKIRIIESTALGQRQRLHLIEVQSRRLLIGSANDSITMLAEIGTPAGEFADELEKIEMQQR